MLSLPALPLLLGTCLPLLWSPPFPLHGPALILLSFAKLSLTLTLSHLTIWTNRSIPFFWQTRLWRTCQLLLLCTLRPLFSFWQVWCAQVFPLKPAPFCKLYAGLGRTNKSVISFFSSSSLTLATLCSPSFFLLPQTLWPIWQKLPSLSCTIRLQRVSGHSFLRGNDAADELARRGKLLVPFAVSFSSFPLISRIHFSPIGGVLSHLHSSTHRLHGFPSANFCSLVTVAVCSLSSSLQRAQPSVKFLSLELAEWRILLAAPADIRPRTPLISFCIVELWTLCAAHCLATICLSTTSGPGHGGLCGFWGSMVFRHATIPRKGSGSNKKKTVANSMRKEFENELTNPSQKLNSI